MSLLRRVCRSLVPLLALVLLATSCSGDEPVAAEPPDFDQAVVEAPTEVPTTASVDPATEATDVAETASQEPTAVPELAGDEDPETDDQPEAPAGIPDVDDVEAVQALFPDPSESPFQGTEIGYTPSENGEIPIIDYNNGQSNIVLNPDFLVMPLCLNSQQNVLGTYISTTSGVRCGFELRPFTGDPEQTCRALFPENEIVELDPQLRVNAQPDSEEPFVVLTIGCAIPVVQEGLDAHFEAGA